MPHTKNTRFRVADFMKNRKEARQKAVEECRVLKAKLYRNKRKLDRLQTKVSRNYSVISDTVNIHLQLGNTDTSARTRPPTILVDGKSKMPPRTAAKRRHETLTHASAIHSGSKSNPDSAFDGMFDTLAKRCKVDKMKDYVLGQKTLKEKVASATFKKNVNAFESSAENAKRSIAVFYSSGVMGKRKYKSVRISLSMKTNETTKGRSAIIVMPNSKIIAI
ncbi:unnamed protein product [Porites lobata]|uniref:Uncharacterized protein n=1 Tax=Porites lobata TaxID=104759 RepID=A0ABN8PYE6_9CNID|nr:unnamed protein product [Porites lobata]